MPKATILIVDDEPINIDLIAQILSEHYYIKVATNGLKALEILKKSQIDLLLLDISMPQIDGYEVAKQMQSSMNTKAIPFIFLTSKDDSHSIVKGFEAGAVDYITKPFNKKELLVRVSNHIKTYLLQRDLEEQKSFIQTILDTQPNMIIISDGVRAEFVNKTFLDFYQAQNLDEFQRKYKCISSTFIHNENYFHEGKVSKDQNWIEAFKALAQDQQIVAISSQVNFKVKAFNVSITDYKNKLYIVTLNDISATILKQLELKKKTLHDRLTHAYNREYFELHYQHYIDEVQLHGEYLGIAMVDIDHFKMVNDRYGHDVGDSVLKEFVEILNQFSRKSDVVIRWGGEEFVIMMKVNSKFALSRALEHYRRIVAQHDFEYVSKVTCSIGGAFYQKGEEIIETIQRADKTLYHSKNSGRNMVSIDSK